MAVRLVGTYGSVLVIIPLILMRLVTFCPVVCHMLCVSQTVSCVSDSERFGGVGLGSPFRFRFPWKPPALWVKKALSQCPRKI